MPRPALKPRLPVLPVLLCLAISSAVVCAAIAVVYSTGSPLRYGDAESHLNIARRIIDSRTPGWGQVGTTWLPLPHLLMLPLVRIDSLWSSGLAGAIPSGCSLAIAVTFLFAAARRLFGSEIAGWSAAGAFLLNPNALHLGAIPMTEAIFFASLFALLYFTVLFEGNRSWIAVAGAGCAGLAGSLTRYESWLLLPFAALYILMTGGGERWKKALVFSVIAGFGPVLWFVHNWWYFGDALDFYRGPYSAMAIQGSSPYPGKNDWRMAAKYLLTAGQLVCGVPALVLGAAGTLVAVARKAFLPALLASIPPLFYLWGLHSAGNPIFVPTLPPFSYYNTRYALAFLPLVAVGCGALATLWRPLGPVAVLFTLSAFLIHPTEPPITWKESEANSRTRLAWTSQAAHFLRANAARGDTYFTSTGDITGIYRMLGIPLRRTLTGDMNPEYTAVSQRPDLFLHEDWVVTYGGDPVQSIVDKALLKGPRYDLATRIFVGKGPVIEIYHRNDYFIPQTARREK